MIRRKGSVNRQRRHARAALALRRDNRQFTGATRLVLNTETFGPRGVEDLFEHIIAQMRELRRCVFHIGVFDRS